MRKNLGVLAAALLVASVLAASAGSLVRDLRLAAGLGKLSWSRRREVLFGPFYPAVRNIRSRLLPSHDIAIIVANPRDRDTAIFADYYLHPRKATLYWGLDSYERNSYEGAPGRRRPSLIILVNTARSPEPRLMTIEQIREELGR